MQFKIGDKVIVHEHQGESGIPDYATVMAVAKNYVMVRYPRAFPFVCAIKEVSLYQQPKQQAGDGNDV